MGKNHYCIACKVLPAKKGDFCNLCKEWAYRKGIA